MACIGGVNNLEFKKGCCKDSSRFTDLLVDVPGDATFIGDVLEFETNGHAHRFEFFRLPKGMRSKIIKGIQNGGFKLQISDSWQRY